MIRIGLSAPSSQREMLAVLNCARKRLGRSEKTLGRLGWDGSSEALGGPREEGAGCPRQEGSMFKGGGNWVEGAEPVRPEASDGKPLTTFLRYRDNLAHEDHGVSKGMTEM